MREYPQAIEMEKKLLSAMMLKQGEAVPAVAEVIGAQDFYRPEHRLIFNAILAAANTDTPLDVILVEEELRRAGDIDKVSNKYLLSLIDYEFSTTRALTYAKTIKEKAQLRRLIDIGAALLDKAGREELSPSELTAEFAGMLTDTDDNATAGFESAQTLLVNACERADKISKSHGLTGTPTGFYGLDKITNGLQRSELILLAARPAMGKTALALNIAQRAAAEGKVVAMFSLEMSKMQLGTRLLSTLSGVAASKLNSGDLSDNDRRATARALDLIGNTRLFVDDTAGLTVAGLRIKAKRFKQEHGLDLIVVDYLQLMQSAVRDNRVQEISEISRGLKLLARELNIPILALSQLNRSVEMRADKRPQLSDLRDSGSLEQDADIVMFLYRDEYYNRDDPENKNLAELIIAKNRNGATATIGLLFRRELTCFDNLTYKDWEADQ